MDKAEALAYVSRLFDAAQAGAVIWGDRLLLKRFLAQCSRTGSAETQEGYRRELRHCLRSAYRQRVIEFTVDFVRELMSAAGEGVKHKQPSVTVGACRQLDALLGLGVNSSNLGRYGWRR